MISNLQENWRFQKFVGITLKSQAPGYFLKTMLNKSSKKLSIFILMIFLIYVLSSQISWKLVRKLLAITRLKLELGVLGRFSLALFKLPIQILIVSSSGILVNKESKSKLAKYNLAFFWPLQVIVYLLDVEGVKNLSKGFDDLEAVVPIADKINLILEQRFISW